MKKIYYVEINNQSYISIHTTTINGDVLIKKGDHVKIELDEDQFNSFYSTVTTSPFLKGQVTINYQEEVQDETERQVLIDQNDEMNIQEKAEEIQHETASQDSCEIAKMEESIEKTEVAQTEKRRGRPRKNTASTQPKELVQEIEVVKENDI